MTSLYIAGSGMCTSLGFDQKATVAAIDSQLDHFRETTFWDNNGEPLLGAMLYDINFWGAARLQWMCEMAIKDCLNQQQENNLTKTALLLLGTDLTISPLTVSGLETVFTALSPYFHPDSLLLKTGKSGVAQALLIAQNMLYKAHSDIEAVLLVGADSYFTAETINHFLHQERLLTSDNSNGFIPGEGAGAILLKKDSALSGIYITGIGDGYEEAHQLQEEKINRSVGLTDAIEKAIATSGIPLSQTACRFSDISGESEYYHEASNAIMRALDKKVALYPHHQLATSLGETGAAANILTLAYLRDFLTSLHGQTHQKNHILLHSSSDTGGRAALIITKREEE